MNPKQLLQKWLGPHAALIQGVSAPLLVVAILAMMVLPLPPILLDTFFTLNIAIALMVMMVAAYMVRPLDFAAFPTVLLLTTLMRLSLNVASTRVVLLEGHTGAGAAGAVIEHLVAGDRLSGPDVSVRQVGRRRAHVGRRVRHVLAHGAPVVAHQLQE